MSADIIGNVTIWLSLDTFLLRPNRKQPAMPFIIVVVIDELRDTADEQLFDNIQTNDFHILYSVLPPESILIYD